MDYNRVALEEEEKFRKFSEDCQWQDICHVVQITHEDGTTYLFRHAKLWKSEVTIGDAAAPYYGSPQFIGVVTEHNGDHFFHTGDLVLWGEYR